MANITLTSTEIDSLISATIADTIQYIDANRDEHTGQVDDEYVHKAVGKRSWDRVLWGRVIE